jgi:hypothetical protein
MEKELRQYLMALGKIREFVCLGYLRDSVILTAVVV